MQSSPLPDAILDLVAAISSASKAITNFIRSVRAAHADLASLTRELSDLRLTLELLRDDNDVPPPLYERIAAVLQSCQDALAGIDAVLAGCWDGALGKARWGGKEKKAAATLQASMQVHREGLGLVLELANLASVKAEVTSAGDDPQEIKQEASRVQDEIARLRPRVAQAECEGRGSVTAMRQYADDIAAYADTVCNVILNERQTQPYSAQSGPRGQPQPAAPGAKGPEMVMIAELPDHERDQRRASDKMVVRDARTVKAAPPFEFQQPLEAVGPWYPPGDGAVPFYNEPSPVPSQASRHFHSKSEGGVPDSGRFPAQRIKRRPITPDPWPTPSLMSRTANEGTSLFSKRTSSQPSIETGSSLFDSSPRPSSIRTNTTMDVLASFPSPPKRSSFQPSLEAPASVLETPSTTSSQTVDRGSLVLPPHGAEVFAAPSMPNPVSAGQPSSPSVVLIPSKRLVDKEKGPGIFQIDVSAARTILASKHANNTVKIWSLVTNTLQSVIKVKSKIQVEARSRTYFIRSHALVSESMAMVAVSASFGNTIELWNWAKRKKVQSIDRAFRWATVREDAYQACWSSLAVYRGEDAHCVDLFNFSRDPSFKKPFGKVAKIDLSRAGLPFTPKYPELAFSTTGPLLVAVSGARPRDPPSAQKPMLVAWHIGQVQGQDHEPYRWTASECKELHMALPSCLAVHGNLAVSIWIPAGHRPVAVAGTAGGYWSKPVVASPSRYALVWNLAENTTRIFSFPNALSCVSPDCRFVAYCDPVNKRLAVLEMANGQDVWSWPNEQLAGLPHFNQLENLNRINELAFSGDGRLLTLGDLDGGVTVYEIWEGEGGNVALQPQG